MTFPPSCSSTSCCPGIDGLGILARLRADTRLCDVPVIMLTAKGTEFDTISGLDAGADDYLAKPFSMMELISRSNALLRRVRRASVAMREGNLVYDSIVLDPHARRVEVGESPVDLTFKEFELLKVLMENPGRALSLRAALRGGMGFGVCRRDAYGGRSHADSAPEARASRSGFEFRARDRSRYRLPLAS